MAVLLLAEVTDGELAFDATAKAIAASKSLGDVTVLCCGASAAVAGDAAAKIDGVAKVLVAEDASLGHLLTLPNVVASVRRRLALDRDPFLSAPSASRHTLR